MPAWAFRIHKINEMLISYRGSERFGLIQLLICENVYALAIYFMQKGRFRSWTLWSEVRL